MISSHGTQKHSTRQYTTLQLNPIKHKTSVVLTLAQRQTSTGRLVFAELWRRPRTCSMLLTLSARGRSLDCRLLKLIPALKELNDL